MFILGLTILIILGRPNEPGITSDAESIYSDQFNLTWSVESHADITSYRIIYRKFLVSKVFKQSCFVLLAGYPMIFYNLFSLKDS